MRQLHATLMTGLLVAGTTIVTGHFETVPSPVTIAPVSLLLNQLEGPLEILDYSALYKEGAAKGEEGVIDHRVTYQNVGDRKVVAIEIVFLSFDIWNKLFDRAKRNIVQALNSSEENEIRLLLPVSKDVDGSSFHTGVSYISRVRFENGEIWSADLSELAAVLKKLAPEISPASL